MVEDDTRRVIVDDGGASPGGGGVPSEVTASMENSIELVRLLLPDLPSDPPS